jgi:hypothetical protein
MPTNLVNGSFEENASGWTASDCTFAIVPGGQVGNCLQVTRTGWSYQGARYAIWYLEVGVTYHAKLYLKRGTCGERSGYVWTMEGSNVPFTLTDEWQLVDFDFVASDGWTLLGVALYLEDVESCLIDEVSVYRDGDEPEEEGEDPGGEEEPPVEYEATDYTFTGEVTTSGDETQAAVLQENLLARLLKMNAMCGGSNAAVISATVTDGLLEITIRANGPAGQSNEWENLVTSFVRDIAESAIMCGQASLVVGTLTPVSLELFLAARAVGQQIRDAGGVAEWKIIKDLGGDIKPPKIG